MRSGTGHRIEQTISRYTTHSGSVSQCLRCHEYAISRSPNLVLPSNSTVLIRQLHKLLHTLQVLRPWIHLNLRKLGTTLHQDVYNWSKSASPGNVGNR